MILKWGKFSNYLIHVLNEFNQIHSLFSPITVKRSFSFTCNSLFMEMSIHSQLAKIRPSSVKFLRTQVALDKSAYFSSSWDLQSCHFPDSIKFSDFSRPRLSSIVSPRPGGMLPQKIFKIRIFNLAENEFQTTKFPDF